jgi:hypothetical protein
MVFPTARVGMTEEPQVRGLEKPFGKNGFECLPVPASATRIGGAGNRERIFLFFYEHEIFPLRLRKQV